VEKYKKNKLKEKGKTPDKDPEKDPKQVNLLLLLFLFT